MAGSPAGQDTSAFDLDRLSQRAAQSAPTSGQVPVSKHSGAGKARAFDFVKEDPSEEYVTENSNKRSLGSSSDHPSTSETGAVSFAVQKKRRRRPQILVPRRPMKQSFRKNNPVRTKVPDEVWQIIFDYSTPRTLVSFRSVSRGFAALLPPDTQIWRCSRENTFGICPDCPPGFSEMRYSLLLEGHGCEAAGCLDTKARKTYWHLGGRLCQPCLQDRIRYEKDLQSAWRDYPLVDRVLLCVPFCAFDTWSRYRGVGNDFPGNHLAYSLKLFLQVYKEAEDVVRMGDSEATETWFRERQTECRERMTKLRMVERFVKDILEPRKAAVATDNKNQRNRVFSQRALDELGIPTGRVIQMNAFKNALRSPAPPTDGCWYILKAKLRAEREALDQVREEPINTVAAPVREENSQEVREDKPSPAVQLMLELADTVIEELDTEPCRELDNLYLVFFDKLRRMYDRSKDVRKATLHLGDCRLAKEGKLDPYLVRQGHLPYWECARFRCPACANRGSRTGRDFVRALDHVFNSHLKNDYGDFRKWRASYNQPGQTVWHMEWPKSLPLLRYDQVGNGRWNLDSTAEYERRQPRPTVISNPFNGRGVLIDPSRSFVDDVLYALKVFRHCHVHDSFKAMIAMKFAVRKFIAVSRASDDGVSVFQPGDPAGMAFGNGCGPPKRGDGLFMSLPKFALASELQQRLLTEGHIQFGEFRCEVCFTTPIVQRPQPSRRRHLFGELISHYEDVGHNPDGWSLFMFAFPSLHDLAMQLHRDEPSRKIFERLFPSSEDEKLLAVFKIVDAMQPIDDEQVPEEDDESDLVLDPALELSEREGDSRLG